MSELVIKPRTKVQKFLDRLRGRKPYQFDLDDLKRADEIQEAFERNLEKLDLLRIFCYDKWSEED